MPSRKHDSVSIRVIRIVIRSKPCVMQRLRALRIWFDGGTLEISNGLTGTSILLCDPDIKAARHVNADDATLDKPGLRKVDVVLTSRSPREDVCILRYFSLKRLLNTLRDCLLTSNAFDPSL